MRSSDANGCDISWVVRHNASRVDGQRPAWPKGLALHRLALPQCSVVSLLGASDGPTTTGALPVFWYCGRCACLRLLCHILHHEVVCMISRRTGRPNVTGCKKLRRRDHALVGSHISALQASRPDLDLDFAGAALRRRCSRAIAAHIPHSPAATSNRLTMIEPGFRHCTAPA